MDRSVMSNYVPVRIRALDDETYGDTILLFEHRVALFSALR